MASGPESFPIDRRRFLESFVAGVHRGHGPRTNLLAGTRIGALPEVPSAARSVAVVEPEVCLAVGGGPCRVCLGACPIAGVIQIGWLAGPEIDAARCDACGRCVVACAAVSDRVALQIG